MLKMIQRMRSMTAAASFQSFLFSLSGSSDLLPSLMCSSSRRISSISLSVVLLVTTWASCGPSCWKSLESLLSLSLPKEYDVGVFDKNLTLSPFSLSVVPLATTCSCGPSCWKSPESLLSLPTEDDVGVFDETLTRSQGASFLSTSHFIWSHTSAELTSAIG